ncbi:hypothetical protein P3T36_000046 [Kitasatospora sp. MAP12-15]|uniref:hypothetical protein n=1 Tax=unclassified Kitasatospora TaxID=2633591 RepID=UPI002474D9B4|nr:hypothetical protein [Kitasatospora sp. MAP12-44]MDH6109274.1 hypothetical protein [Kitasatospora sp. MAP12-44]
MSNLSLLTPAAIAFAVVLRAASKRRASPSSPAARPAGPAPVSLDHDHGDPELTALRTAVTRGDWDGVAAVLQPCRDRGDHARLTSLVTCVQDMPGNLLLDIGRSRSDDPLARTVSGARHVAWAWEARSRAQASRVSREQFDLFHERLRGAEEHLYAAVELDPDSAAPWTFLTTASRGLEHGHDVTRRRFEAGVRRAPTHVALHSALLQQVCAKWSGSHEEMHGFARESLAKAPPGSGLGMLTAEAHIEHWLDLPSPDDAAYMRSPEVVEELRQAAAASVLHPDYSPTESPYPALNTFALAFWLAGDLASARQLFERIGDHATRFPWAYCGNPGQVFAKARQECKKAKPAKTAK